MIGKIKVEEGVYRVTIAEAVYITPDMTLKDLIDSGFLLNGVQATIVDENGESKQVTMQDMLAMIIDLQSQIDNLQRQIDAMK